MITVVLRNRSKAIKQVSDFMIAFRDFVVNNNGIDKDVLFRFVAGELVLMQGAENWLRCRETACFLFFQPGRDTYSLAGPVPEGELCYSLKSTSLVGLLTPLRRSLSTLRLTFSASTLEVEGVLLGGSRLRFETATTLLLTPPPLTIDFHQLLHLGQLSPAMSKTLSSKPRLYHILLL